MELEPLGHKTQNLNVVWNWGSLYTNRQDTFDSTELKVLKWEQLDSHNYDQDCFVENKEGRGDTCVCAVQRQQICEMR